MFVFGRRGVARAGPISPAAVHRLHRFPSRKRPAQASASRSGAGRGRPDDSPQPRSDSVDYALRLSLYGRPPRTIHFAQHVQLLK